MRLLLSFVAWPLQLGALLLLPGLLFVLLRKRKPTAAAVALLCAVLIFAGAAWLAFHPIRCCPEELEPYMTEARWQDILSVTPPIYNRRIPFFPAVITVERATTDELYWKVDWFLAGTTRTGITPDGYDLVHSLK